MKIVFVQVHKKDGAKAFIDIDSERGVYDLIKTGKLSEGKTAKAGNLKVKVIKIADVKGTLIGNGEYIFLPSLTDKAGDINLDALKEWYDWNGDLKEMLRVFWIQGQTALVGEKGVGKNKVMEVIAKLYNMHYYEIPSSEDLTSYDLVGKYAPSEKEGTIAEWIDGILTEWTKNGGVLVWDEPNVCRGGIMLRAHAVLDFRQHLALKEHKGEIIPRSKDSYLALTFNPPRSEYMGVEVLNIAFLDRFSVFYMDYAPSEDEAKIVDGTQDVHLTVQNSVGKTSTRDLIRVANKIREAYMRGEIHDTVSTRQLQLVRNLVDNGMGAEKSLEICIVNRFFNDEKNAVRELVEVAKGDIEGDVDE